MGYKLRPKTYDGPDFRIDFLTKDEALTSNLDYDALIIPSGIYERFSTVPDRDGPRIAVQSDPDVIRKMEAKITHHLDRAKWVCFLVDEIVDRINEDHPKVRATVVNDTDLCKKMLNRFGLQRSLIQTATSLEVKAPAFLSYAQKYASPKTVFSPPKDLSIRELMSCSLGMTSFVLANQLFFIPFFRNHSRHSELVDPIVELLNGIQIYLENPNAHAKEEEKIPDWAEIFSFETENKILQEQKDLKQRLEKLKIDLQIFRKFKALLTQTGASLQSLVEFVLKEFFQHSFTVDGRAIKLLDGSNRLLCILTTDSCQGPVQRSAINEVDNIRESLGFSHSTLGALIVNDSLEANSLEDKERASLDSEKIEHSKRQNVCILRTIDLLRYMKQWEHLGFSDRRKEFFRVLQGGEAGSIDLKSHGEEKKLADQNS